MVALGGTLKSERQDTKGLEAMLSLIKVLEVAR